MRNLLLFFWKYQFTFIFLLLEVVAFALLSSSNRFQSSKLHEFGVTMSGSIYSLQEGYNQYIGLRDENELLRQENARLREQVLDGGQQTQQVTHLGMRCIETQAISSTYHLGNNFVLINSGRKAGVERESAVIGPSGIVGLVHSVSDDYASVLPLLSSHAQVNARLQNTSYFGICRWNGQDDQFITLEDIPNHVQIDKGDTVVTRGSGGIYPPGLLIGLAESSEHDESSGFQKVRLRLATDFRKLHSLYVIVNEAKPQLDSLQQTLEEWTEK